MKMNGPTVKTRADASICNRSDLDLPIAIRRINRPASYKRAMPTALRGHAGSPEMDKFESARRLITDCVFQARRCEHF